MLCFVRERRERENEKREVALIQRKSVEEGRGKMYDNVVCSGNILQVRVGEREREVCNYVSWVSSRREGEKLQRIISI